MPKFTINGKDVEVKDGETVIQGFKKLGEDIAHYCWHPGLSIAGVCRMCMVEIEGQPRLQIACNLPAMEGMKVRNDTQKVKDAVKWALDFHLINHPLDCPICDQAGECKLQDYYMKYGLYDPEMNQHKVKKRKVISLGDRVVLDAERCILCSRCVRFTNEVTKTYELGIFNRGDRSEIGTFDDRPLNNNYSVNTVDICPVGALTSKDFRFKQRVWFLKEFDTVCTGCSAGCNISVGYNNHGVFRIKPRVNMDVNTYWMCDEGRLSYKHVNREYRQTHAQLSSGVVKSVEEALAEVREDSLKANGKVALVLTGQNTNEEYADLLSVFKQEFKGSRVYYWKNNPETFESFDGLLIRGDKNPNTQGLLKTAEALQVKLASLDELEKDLSSFEVLWVVGPENQEVYPDLGKRMSLFGRVKKVAMFSVCRNDAFAMMTWVIPSKSFVEKNGTIVNVKGLAQKLRAGTEIVDEAVNLSEVATVLKGGSLQRDKDYVMGRPGKHEPQGLWSETKAQR